MQTTPTSPTVHTNAEIAAKLFIAAKTVDPCVSAELAKLDARLVMSPRHRHLARAGRRAET